MKASHEIKASNYQDRLAINNKRKKGKCDLVCALQMCLIDYNSKLPNSLGPSDAYMRRLTNHHWFR